MQAVFVESMAQCGNDMLLAHHAFKIMRAPLAGKNLVAHRLKRLKAMLAVRLKRAKNPDD